MISLSPRDMGLIIQEWHPAPTKDVVFRGDLHTQLPHGLARADCDGHPSVRIGEGGGSPVSVSGKSTGPGVRMPRSQLQLCYHL